MGIRRGGRAWLTAVMTCWVIVTIGLWVRSYTWHDQLGYGFGPSTSDLQAVSATWLSSRNGVVMFLDGADYTPVVDRGLFYSTVNRDPRVTVRNGLY